jgi:hypothetical protein
MIDKISFSLNSIFSYRLLCVISSSQFYFIIRSNDNVLIYFGSSFLIRRQICDRSSANGNRIVRGETSARSMSEPVKGGETIVGEDW